MQTSKFILVLCLYFIIPLGIGAENTTRKWMERYNVTYLTIDEGLPYNSVEDIVKDSHGFLWIASSSEGITRYDGHEYLSFNMGTKRAKLRSNFIHKMCEDRFGRLWVASEVGIDIIDLKQLVNGKATEEELVGNWEHIDLGYSYGNQKTSSVMTLGADHKITAGTWKGSSWSFDASKQILTANGVQLYVQRETDWEASPRKHTIVYVGLNKQKTYWGKKSN